MKCFKIVNTEAPSKQFYAVFKTFSLLWSNFHLYKIITFLNHTNTNISKDITIFSIQIVSIISNISLSDESSGCLNQMLAATSGFQRNPCSETSRFPESKIENFKLKIFEDF